MLLDVAILVLGLVVYAFQAAGNPTLARNAIIRRQFEPPGTVQHSIVCTLSELQGFCLFLAVSPALNELCIDFSGQDAIFEDNIGSLECPSVAICGLFQEHNCNFTVGDTEHNSFFNGGIQHDMIPAPWKSFRLQALN
ncbi:hypothetical protein BYT27DRAFT_7212858 [Phlegmacium glaucopus]|nr:hypothetical protein BYT27DRAFT_7212858 [Phlegmacium glaucopus]